MLSVCRDNSRLSCPLVTFGPHLRWLILRRMEPAGRVGTVRGARRGEERDQGGCTERHHRGERYQVIQPRPRLAVKLQRDPRGGGGLQWVGFLVPGLQVQVGAPLAGRCPDRNHTKKIKGRSEGRAGHVSRVPMRSPVTGGGLGDVCGPAGHGTRNGFFPTSEGVGKVPATRDLMANTHGPRGGSGPTPLA